MSVISMRETTANSPRQRNGSLRSRGTRTTPQQSSEPDTTAPASTKCTRKAAEPSAKMALTCKVQYLDDTDPFASTNFPEPTRPPTYTFHLNIPLCQQVDGLHRLLCAPHAIDDVALQLSHNGCYLDLENTLEEQADLLEGFLDSRKNTTILRTSLSVRVHTCIAKLLAASGRELRRALFSLKQIFQDDKDLVHEFVNSDGLNALITVGQDADQNYQNYILRAIGQIMLYVDGMNGVINHNETIQWLYSLTASKFRLVAKTSLKLLLVFVEYTEYNSRLLTDAVQCVDDSQGIKHWAEVLGILAEKDSLGDEEILIYAMTLLNKVLYATPDQDMFYDITDDLEEQNMENIIKTHQDRRGTNIDLLEQLNIYETALRIEDGDEELPAYGGSPSIRPRKRTAAMDCMQGDRRRSRRHHSVSKIDLAINNLRGEDFRNKRQRGGLNNNNLHKSAPDMTSRYGEPPPSPVRSSGSASPSSSTQDLDELDEKERNRQARRERRAARRAALGFPVDKNDRPTDNRTETQQQASRDVGLSNSTSSRLDIRQENERLSPAPSPSASPSSSVRSSPRGSPTASPLVSRRRAQFQKQVEDAEGIEAVRQRTLKGSWEERRKAREELRRLEQLAKEENEQAVNEVHETTPDKQAALKVTAVAKRRSGEISTDENENITIDRTTSPQHVSIPHSASHSASHSEGESSEIEGVMRRRKPKLDEIGRSGSVQDKGMVRSPSAERKDSTEKRSSICEVLPGSTNKKMMLSMLYGQQKSTDDLFDKKPTSPSFLGESVGDRRARLLSSGESEGVGESSVNDIGIIENSVHDTVKKLDVVEEEGKDETNAPEGDFDGVINRAKKSLMKQESIDEEAERKEEERRQQEEIRRQQEEEERQRIAAEEAARLQELEWERMITLKRSLIVKDFDFTDLIDEDDIDALESLGHDEADFVRPPNLFAGIPPPPPGLSMFPPPPPPPPGGGMPPPPPGPPKPPLLGNFGTLNKKKMVRLFWQEVKNSPLINGVNKTIWGSIDQVDVDTKKLEHLFENKTSAKIKQRLEEDKDKRKEIIVLDIKRSQQINIALTKLPPIRTLKQAILNMDSTVIDREGVDKLLQMQPSPDEKTKIQEAQLANPDVPLGSAEQFLLTMASVNELAPRLHLWAFKLDYDTLEKEVAEPLMDLKEALEELSKNITFKHILATLLAIGNFLNGKKVKGFQLDYLSKVPEVKDTVHKQSLLYHLCCMVMEKFPGTTDLYSELGALHRSSRVDFEVVAENLKNLRENCKRSWEHLSIVAKHDSTKQLKSKMTELLTDAQERITILKVVHRRVSNRFRKMLLYLGVSTTVTKKTKVNEFCKIISEFSLEYRTTRGRVLEQKKKRENLRERNRTRGKMITESFGTHGRTPSEENVEEAFRKALFSNGDDVDSAKDKLKSSTLPNTRNRSRSSRQSTDDFPDDNTDEVMDMLVKSATMPESKTRVRKPRIRLPNSNRKSARRTLKSGITPEDMEKLTKQVQILEKK